MINAPINVYAVSPANTLIENQATATYEVEDSLLSVASNLVSFRVLEVINHTVVTNNPTGIAVTSPNTKRALSFTLTNTGNGTDQYTLSVQQPTSDDFDAIVPQIYIDQDNDGVFNADNDVLYTAGSNDPSLLMGASVNLFIVSDIPASRIEGDEAEITLVATSSAGTGTPGDLVAGGGDGGVDAVYGFAGGQAQDQSVYIVSEFSVAVDKSQSILDPTGGSKATKDSVITYTLDITISGAGTITDAALEDIIPVGTTYIAGSLTLDGVSKTDAADTDEANFDGSKVNFTLGSVTAPSSFQAVFRVRVQ